MNMVIKVGTKIAISAINGLKEKRKKMTMTNLSHNSTRVGALDLEVSFQQSVPHLDPGEH